MSWNDLSLNPRVVLAYYSEPPALESVEVHSVKLHRDGPTLEAMVELPDFPDKPSHRWHPSSNAARASLRFFGVQNLRVEGWQATNVGRWIIEPNSAGVKFEFRGNGVVLAGTAITFDIPRIDAYTKGA